MQELRLTSDEPRTPDQALQRIAQTGQQLFMADACIIVAVNPITRAPMEPFVATNGSLQAADLLLNQARLQAMNDQLNQQGMVILENAAEHQEYSHLFSRNRTIQTLAAVVLRTERYQKLLAGLYLLFNQPHNFTHHEINQLQSFASAAASVLQNVWLLHRYHHVSQAGHEINQDLTTIEALFKKLEAHLPQIIGADYFLLGVHRPQNPPERSLDLFTLQDDESKFQPEQPLRGGSGWVIRRQEPLSIEHLSEEMDTLPTELVPLPGLREDLPESVIFTPLSFRLEPLGMLSVQHHQPRFYDADDLRVLRLLGNHVALALSNIRLFESVRELNESGQLLMQRLTSEDKDVLQSIIDRIRDATKADIVTLFPYSRLTTDPGFDRHPYISGTLRVRNYPRDNPSRRDDIALLTLNKAEPIFEKDSNLLYTTIGGQPEDRQGNFEEREEVLSTAALPLLVGQEGTDREPIGVLFINFRQRQRFDDTQKQLISGLANFAAIAIRNSREFDRQKRRREQELELLQKIDREIRQSLSLEVVMHRILKQTFPHIDRATEASIALFNPRTQRLEAKAAIGRNAEHRTQQVFHWFENKGITRWVFKEKKPVRVDNVRTDPIWSKHYVPVAEDILSEMDVPLVDDDKVVGVINFESTYEAAFTSEDERFLKTLAEQAVLAIRSAQAYNELNGLHNVDRSIIEQLENLDDVMNIILEYMLSATAADIAEMHLFENGKATTIYIARQPEQPEPLNQPLFERQEASSPQGKEGIVAYVARTRNPYLSVGDVKSNNDYIGDPNVHSEIAYPLLSGDEVIGVLNLESYRQDIFDAQDLETLSRFAGQAVIAVQNARNYAQARLEQRRFQMLYRAGRELGAIADISQLKQAYDIVVRIAGEAFESQAVIRSYDEQQQQLVLERAVDHEVVAQFERMSINEGINGWVARNRQTRVVDDVAGPDGVDAMLADPRTRSLVVTPIQVGDNYYGNLSLSHERPGYFSDADLDLLKGLAQQLAMTIYRLYTVAAHQLSEQRAKEAELMGSIGQASMEITHRLGNDLGLIQTYVNRIRRAIQGHGLVDAAFDENLDKILRDVGKVRGLSSRLKEDFAQSQGGKATSPAAGTGLRKPDQQFVVIPMHVLVEEAIQGLPPVPPRVALHNETPSNLASVRVVASEIADIVTNLVGNAVEAMPSGGTITLRARNMGQFVRLDVIDTGVGIAPEDLPQIFDLLYSTKGSSGFGLWSARRNALANGGDLTVKSEVGKGSMFTLVLPRVDQPPGAEL